MFFSVCVTCFTFGYILSDPHPVDPHLKILEHKQNKQIQARMAAAAGACRGILGWEGLSAGTSESHIVVAPCGTPPTTRSGSSSRFDRQQQEIVTNEEEEYE